MTTYWLRSYSGIHPFQSAWDGIVIAAIDCAMGAYKPVPCLGKAFISTLRHGGTMGLWEYLAAEKKAIANRAFQVFGFLILQVAIFFAVAGRLDIPRAWLLFGMYLVHVLVNMVFFLKYAPEIVAARGKYKFVKTWDKVVAGVYTAMLLVLPAVMGLDVGRGLSSLGIEFAVAGVIMFVIGGALSTWAMVVNKWFVTTVIVQKGQRVVSTGPYAIVRHPGYGGLMLYYLAAPLVVGSLYGLIPAAIIALAHIVRTQFEDKTLYNELPGYREYTQKVKYRLLPGVW